MVEPRRRIIAFCPPLCSSAEQSAGGDGRGGREGNVRREGRRMTGFGWPELDGLYVPLGPSGWLDKPLPRIMAGPVSHNAFLVVFGGGDQPRRSRTTGNRRG